jgi:hypothetical protein
MPTPEHVAALARALVPDAWDDNSDGLKSDLRRAALRAMGGRVFAAIASDPAAQDAVLAALVEGGRLVEEEGLWPCPSRHYDRDHNGEWCDEACRSYEGHAGDHECVSGRHWPRTADDLPRKVHWIEPEWREVPNA